MSEDSDYTQDSRILDLFGDERSADGFRLAILGFATLEDRLGEGLAEAFGGVIPSPLRRIPFKARVSLAIALGVIPEAFRKPLMKLADVRHQLAQES